MAQRHESVWSRWLPGGWSWLRLFTWSTAYLLVLSSLASVAARGVILAELPGAGIGSLPWAAAPDVAVLLGLAALFSFGEARSPWLLWITVPLVLLVGALSAMNAFYLLVTGEQLGWQSVALGVDRIADVVDIAGQRLVSLGASGWVAMTAVLLLPFLARWALRGAGHRERVDDARGRGKCALLLAGLAAVLWVALPSPRALSARRLGGSTVLATYWGWVNAAPAAPDAMEFVGYPHPQLVNELEVARFSSSEFRPNVLLLVLESTRQDVTSLAGGPPGRPIWLPWLGRERGSSRLARTCRTPQSHCSRSSVDGCRSCSVTSSR